MTDAEEIMGEALHRIAQWSDAYPLAVFPEPDDEHWRRAAAALAAADMTLDRLTASTMRRVIRGVGRIAKEALQQSAAAQRASAEGVKED